MTVAIGIDLGGTKLDIGLVDQAGKIIDHHLTPTNVAGGPEGIIKTMIECVKVLKARAGEIKLESIGVAIAGQIDGNSGLVKFAPNLRWHDVNIMEPFKKAFQVPIKIVNDVRAAAWGEWRFGAGQGVDNLICLFIGTGIGSGIILDGKMLKGNNNSAGEVGHMVLSLNGLPCTCGNRGCWETLAGGWGITAAMKKAVAEHPKEGKRLLDLAKGDSAHLSPSQLFKAVQENDPFAVKLMENIEAALISGTVTLANAFNPELFIFGGGIIHGAPLLIEKIEYGVRQNALKSSTEKLRFTMAQLPVEAVVVGAADISREI